MEQWVKIPNFSRYEASNLGRLRSLNYKNSKRIKILKPADSGGYLKTMLQMDSGKYRSKTVHYFITLTFLGERKEGLEVNHIDGNKHNNNINNLEYCTRSENINHSWKTGLSTPNKGESNGMSKLTESQVLAIRKVASEGGRYYGRKKLAKKYKVSETCIKEIVNKRRGLWSHI